MGAQSGQILEARQRLVFGLEATKEVQGHYAEAGKSKQTLNVSLS